MRLSVLSAAGVSVAALALATTLSPVAGASSPRLAPTSHGSHGATANSFGPMKKGNCYSSLQNDTGNAINSQNFESSFDQYDNELADSFSVKKTCKVTGIYVTGQYYNGAGPATSETVTFYADAGGEPGAVENSQTVVGIDNAGTFLIDLETVALSPGKHWVSVVANMDFATGGQWGWELTTNIKSSGEAMWRNPGDGFGSGCVDFMPVGTCTGSSGDTMFTLLK